MKKVNLTAKLSLGKEILTKLENGFSAKINGGELHTRDYTCPRRCGLGGKRTINPLVCDL